MKKIFIVFACLILGVTPCLAYSYCYKDMTTGHRICTQYTGGYNMYNNPYYNPYRMPQRRYYNTAPIGGGTTVVKYNSGFPVAIQKG